MNEDKLPESEDEGFAENVRVIHKSPWPPLETDFPQSSVEEDFLEEDEPVEAVRSAYIEGRREMMKSLHPSSSLSKARKARASAIATALQHIEDAQDQLAQAIEWVGVYADNRDFTQVKNSLSSTVQQIKFDMTSEKDRR